MAALEAAIHLASGKIWMAGSSPAMTIMGLDDGLLD